MPSQEGKARFIEPMLLQRTPSLPEGPAWAYEIKLDGYRALAIKLNGKVLLRSRNNKDFNSKYPGIVTALSSLPDETVIDGEVVAFDQAGRPSFNPLQNAGSSKLVLVYYVFDVLILGGRNVIAEPLSKRRDLVKRHVLPKLSEPIRESAPLNASLSDVIEVVKAHGLEGIVAKRLDSRYEPGQRSGAWLKMRVNQGQEFFDRWLHAQPEELRRSYFRVLRRGAAPVCRQNPQRVYAGHASPSVSALPHPGDSRLSVREPT